MSINNSNVAMSGQPSDNGCADRSPDGTIRDILFHEASFQKPIEFGLQHFDKICLNTRQSENAIRPFSATSLKQLPPKSKRGRKQRRYAANDKKKKSNLMLKRLRTLRGREPQIADMTRCVYKDNTKSESDDEMDLGNEAEMHDKRVIDVKEGISDTSTETNNSIDQKEGMVEYMTAFTSNSRQKEGDTDAHSKNEMQLSMDDTPLNLSMKKPVSGLPPDSMDKGVENNKHNISESRCAQMKNNHNDVALQNVAGVVTFHPAGGEPGEMVRQVKRITIEELPLNISGVKPSGSGVQLSVKMDLPANSQRPNNVMRSTQKPRKRRKMEQTNSRMKKRASGNNMVGNGIGPTTSTTYRQDIGCYACTCKEDNSRINRILCEENSRIKHMACKEDARINIASREDNMRINHNSPRGGCESSSHQQGTSMTFDSTSRSTAGREVSNRDPNNSNRSNCHRENRYVSEESDQGPSDRDEVGDQDMRVENEGIERSHASLQSSNKTPIDNAQNNNASTTKSVTKFDPGAGPSWRAQGDTKKTPKSYKTTETLPQFSKVEPALVLDFLQRAQNLRKDLKEKHKDINHMLKSFEDVLKEHGISQTQASGETSSSDNKSCAIM